MNYKVRKCKKVRWGRGWQEPEHTGLYMPCKYFLSYLPKEPLVAEAGIPGGEAGKSVFAWLPAVVSSGVGMWARG